MTHSLPRILASATLLATLPPVLPAQADWRTDVIVPKPRAVHAAAFDLGRNQLVLFGGNTNSGVQADTWLWSVPGGWTKANPTRVPPARREHGMAYDLFRGNVVMFGGFDSRGTALGDTWIWDGSDWTQASPANSPSPRSAEIALDVTGSQVLLFGGDAGSGTRLNDTWGWNGTDWTALQPAMVPPARADHGIATDWTAGRVVMFGGWDSVFRGDTWLWQGTDWQLQAASGPPARSEHRMAFDGANVVLFSGDTGSGRPQETWLWTGTAWQQQALANQPAGREEHELVSVPGVGVLLFGGWAPVIGHLADPWVYTGGAWLRVGKDAPPGTGTHAMAIDPTTGRTLMFGGYQDTQVNGETWSYANRVWQQLSPAARPPARAEAAMAFDQVRGEFVLFGGANGSTYYDDTWVFSGGNWAQRSPVNRPPARWGHVMAFDANRGTVVLYSGRQGGSSANLQDTWEWNGTGWTDLNLTPTPPGREDPALVHDSARNELLLFGGWVQGSGFANDTWALRNGAWVALSPPQLPSARSEHVMAYDSWRDRVVMFAGQDGTGRVADTWEWDGTTWIQRSPATSPQPREEAAMVFDPIAGESILFAGWDVGHFTDTWHYSSLPSATVVTYGTGCAGTGPGAPALASSRLWLGDNVTMTMTAPAPQSAALLLFGVAKTNVDLVIMGMPGCSLLNSPLLVFPMSINGTVATFGFPVPTTGSLIGVQVLCQGAAGQPGTNPQGLLATAGLELTAAMK